MPKRYIVLSGLLMWGLFVIGRFYGHDNPGLLAGTLENFTMLWMATLFLCAVCLLLVDLLTGFGWLWSRHTAWLHSLGLIAGLGLSVIALVQGMRPPVVNNYEVALKGLPKQLEGTVIVAVSDLHLGSRLGEKWLAARVAQIEAAQPDLVFLLGDLYEGHSDPSSGLHTAMAQLNPPLGVWAVLGNHEFHRGGESTADVSSDNGFTVLRNSWTEVAPGLILVGVDDLTRSQSNGNGTKILAQALAQRPEGTTILLSHSPLYDDVAAAAGVDLMLSGHTHGGQLWPFDYLVQQRYPLLEGRHQTGDMTVLVCRGTGTWGPRMRLWNPGEILQVTLRQSATVLTQLQ